ncbi:hypothetical protein CKN99_07220 [Carnobacterium maltaromaticum]|nr:hypothetical protein CKN90_07175 [Carnobacterium maltaromaticum]TFJ31688.1 hypothetical protein CKN98_07185 [Carnobacterium maltaromaticum]TFJ35982.1 hypothetical protein CKN88_07240 [Carnobacterium maltaromaticum]TFJ37890.1 hypothetical protein CKN99_07220 [Carnobacterium maltaromaticum]TFJ45740.1 hypothetical protein CKN92_06650 [Carnobacterium maltaromaticum]
MSQLLEKKIKIREDKKRPINFPYFLTGANRLNKLFIKASSYELAPREKDKNSRGQKAYSRIFPIFLSELTGSTSFLFKKSKSHHFRLYRDHQG